MTEEIQLVKPSRNFDWDDWGCLILFFAGMLFFCCILPMISRKHEFADLRVRGRVSGGLFSSPHFEMSCWQQNPGNLERGKLTITVSGKSVAGGTEYCEHSFEIWEPNEDHAVAFIVDLENYRASEPIVVKLYLTAANAHDTTYIFTFQNNRWQ